MFASLPLVRWRALAAFGFAVVAGGICRADSAPWMSDLQNGRYKNPVLYADYSDPDAIRVGEDYYLISSSFLHAPGLPVLHSRDLVNWTLLSHALPALVPLERFSTPRHGEGVWAPAIRYWKNRYWIYYPDPDFGLYLVTATNPAGPWSSPVLVKSGKGLIDPCPFWDDDGKLYLVHGWAKSRAGIANRLTIAPLSEDGTHFIGEDKLVVDGDAIPGWRTLEGPKLYKRHGYYYIFAPSGGVKTGWQAVFRSKTIYGPYEHRIVMDQGKTEINGPHQGAWVDTPSGQDWFLHFQDREAYGRVVLLEPMVWKDDWPVIGEDPDGDGKGQPVLFHLKPDVPTQPLAVPITTDEFDGPGLALSWQWQANPRPEWATLAAVRGSLRLFCVPTDANLYRAPNLLLQKFPAPEFEAVTELHFSTDAVGDQSGLIVFGYDYAWIGLRNTPAGVKLCWTVHKESNEKDAETSADLVDVSTAPAVQLRVRVRSEALCEFAYSIDGRNFVALPDKFHATPDRWVGAKFGLFAGHVETDKIPSASPGSAIGKADFSWFRVSAISAQR